MADDLPVGILSAGSLTAARMPGAVDRIGKWCAGQFVLSARRASQRDLGHRIRNSVAKVPENVWPDVKFRAQAACQAPSRAD